MGNVYDAMKKSEAERASQASAGQDRSAPLGQTAGAEQPDVVDADTLIVTADGEMAYIADYPLSHTPGETRPTIDIYFQSIDRMYSTTLVLEPHAGAPRRSDGSGRLQARMPVDLDAAGRSREDW